MRLKNLHYGWVIVVIGACVLAVHASVIYGFGIFLRPLTMEFGWERGALSVAFSISFLVGGGLGIFTGRLSDKYGPRILVTLYGLLIGIGFLLMSQINSLWQVYLIWALLIGVGSSCVWVPILSTIPRWFAGKRGVAMGLTVAGLGVGGVISPPLAQWLISSYGWQQAYIVFGLITLIIVIPLAQFMKHSPQRIGLKPYGEEGVMAGEQSMASAVGGFSFKETIRTSRFWLFGLALFCFLFVLELILVHLAPHAVDTGISAMVAASIVSVVAIASVIGRFSSGFITDKVGARLTLVACLSLVTLALIWLLFAREIWMFYIFAVVFGFAYGGTVPLEMLVPAELFGLESSGVIFGGLIFIGTIGGALGGPLGGGIFDVTGSYSLALLISIIIGALAIILSLILLRAKGWRGLVKA